MEERGKEERGREREGEEGGGGGGGGGGLGYPAVQAQHIFFPPPNKFSV